MMSIPTRNGSPGVTRHEELAISGTVLSDAPWAAAGAVGAVVGGRELVLPLIVSALAIGRSVACALVLPLMLWHLAIVSSVSMGAVAFFAAAAAGALWRSRRSRAASWARRNPWRFAVAPG